MTSKTFPSKEGYFKDDDLLGWWDARILFLAWYIMFHSILLLYMASTSAVLLAPNTWNLLVVFGGRNLSVMLGRSTWGWLGAFSMQSKICWSSVKDLLLSQCEVYLKLPCSRPSLHVVTVMHLPYCFLSSPNLWINGGHADFLITVIFSFSHGRTADDDCYVLIVLLLLVTFARTIMVWKGLGLDQLMGHTTPNNIESVIQTVHGAKCLEVTSGSHPFFFGEHQCSPY